MRLKDKVSIITGGASGIGRASSILFAKEGSKVIVADINLRGAEETCQMIADNGGTAVAVKVDVTKNEEIKNMVETAIKEFGRLDVLYHNAGYPCTVEFEDITEEEWDMTFNINTKALFLACKYAVPIMKKQGGGVILVTSSIAGIRVRPTYSAYSASKAASTTLIKGLAIEFGKYNIRANSLNPVATDTPMFPRFIIGKNVDFETGKKAFIEGIPLGRLAKPEDVANAAVWLASDEASFITGIALPIDGGRSI